MTSGPHPSQQCHSAPLRAKSDLRGELLLRRQSLLPAERQEASAAILGRLRAHLAQQHPHLVSLLCYRALASEVETAPLFSAPPCAIYAPVMHGRVDMHWWRVAAQTEWRHGALGVLEPQSTQLWQPAAGESVLVAPLVGFDRAGSRLGMGLGCFDRWLADQRAHMGALIGLAFSCQEVEAIAHDAHDIPLDWIITEKESIACRSG